MYLEKLGVFQLKKQTKCVSKFTDNLSFIIVLIYLIALIIPDLESLHLGITSAFKMVVKSYLKGKIWINEGVCKIHFVCKNNFFVEFLSSCFKLSLFVSSYLKWSRVPRKLPQIVLSCLKLAWGPLQLSQIILKGGCHNFQYFEHKFSWPWDWLENVKTKKNWLQKITKNVI